MLLKKLKQATILSGGTVSPWEAINEVALASFFGHGLLKQTNCDLQRHKLALLHELSALFSNITAAGRLSAQEVAS